MLNRLPTHSRLLLGFALAQPPLMALALATGWTGSDPAVDSELADVALNGSSISGPLTAPAWFLVAVHLTGRRGRAGLVGTALVLLAGVLIMGNGFAALVSDVPSDTPGGGYGVAAVVFMLAGAAIASATLGSLLRKAVPAPAR